jgi:hypothetical protein
MTPTSWNPIEPTSALAGQTKTTLTPHNVVLPPETKILLFKKPVVYTANLIRGLLDAVKITHTLPEEDPVALCYAKYRKKSSWAENLHLRVFNTTQEFSRVCRLARALQSHREK